MGGTHSLMNKSVTVIIPVYNAFEASLACIDSVMMHLPEWANVIVIDDKSPQGNFIDIVPLALKENPKIQFLRNESNLGFVGTCNLGMLVLSENDVLLLNSDTVVTSNWLTKMQACAYSRAKVGTVTCLTNNGTIASVPNFLENNTLPNDYSLHDFAELISNVSAHEYPELPTCVGFCVYVRRELIDTVGGFDPEFGKGYGEENDLSLRGQKAGFVDLLDDSTFVFHKGNMSFKESRESLSKENTLRLKNRYPNYENAVAKFCSENPLSNIHTRIINELLINFISTKKRRVLQILHNGPYTPRRHELGGTELHVQALISHIDDTSHFALTPDTNSYILTAFLGSNSKEIHIPKNFKLNDLLKSDFFDLIHLHHIIGFDEEELYQALKLHGNYIVSIHDYSLICERNFLWTPELKICDGISCKSACEGYPGSLGSKRSMSKELLENSERVITFSDSSEAILNRVFDRSFPILKIPHGINLPKRKPFSPSSKPSNDTPVRVLLIGNMVAHKGLYLVEKLVKNSMLNNKTPIEWHFLGNKFESIPELIDHGSYDKDSLQDKVASISPHLALLLPQCQETYSITFDEIIWCGVPVIVSPFGAPQERVKNWDVGIDCENSDNGVLKAIEKMVNEEENYSRYLTNAKYAPIINLSDEASLYRKLYEELAPDKNGSDDALLMFLQPNLCSSRHGYA